MDSWAVVVIVLLAIVLTAVVTYLIVRRSMVASSAALKAKDLIREADKRATEQSLKLEKEKADRLKELASDLAGERKQLHLLIARHRQRLATEAKGEYDELRKDSAEIDRRLDRLLGILDPEDWQPGAAIVSSEDPTPEG